jgi:predicted ATPase
VLTGVQIRGFKAIPRAGINLDLRPLTLLVGPTGCGKSSVLEGIALLAQSTRTQEKIQLTPAGRLVQLSSEDWPRSHVDLLHGYDADSALTIEVSLRLDSRHVRYGFSVAAILRQHDAAFEQWLVEDREEVHFRRDYSGEQYVTVARRRSGAEHRVQGEVQRLLDSGLFVIASGTAGDAKYELEGFRVVADAVATFLTSSKLRYIGEWRGAPPLRSPDVRGESRAAGGFGENLLRMLAVSGPRSARMQEAQRTAERFGLKNLHTGVEDGLLASWFEDPFTGMRIKLEHAGSGSQQALPILADLFDLDEGGTLLLEEPERGWHPKYLPAWGATLAAAAQRGAQVIATTHTPDLVLACALAVKNGLLPSDAFVAYDLERSRDAIAAREVRIDPKGRLSPSFVKSYGDAESALLGALLSPGDEPEGQARETPASRRVDRVRESASQQPYGRTRKKARKASRRT